MKQYSVSGTIEAVSPAQIDGAAEGVYFLENFPRAVSNKDDEFHREFNKIMEIDDVHAQEIGTDRVMAKSHAWQSWENLFVLKQAIEESGWKQKSDDQGVIEALEGLEMSNSLAHPQGSKILRAEDHSGMIDCYITQVQNDEFQLIQHVPKEELMNNLPPRYDFTKYDL